MLRITVHQDQASWRLQLEGKLAGPWVDEAAATWRSAALDGRALEVDLTGVTSVDGEGWALLRALHRAGARFIAKGVEMNALVREMNGRQSCTRGWKKVEWPIRVSSPSRASPTRNMFQYSLMSNQV